MTNIEIKEETLLDKIRQIQVGPIWREFCERIKWIGYKEGNIERHARHEMELTGWFDDDSCYDGEMAKAVLRLSRVFADEGHSGMSASIAVGLFKRLAMYEVLSPLTGEEHEWSEPLDHTGLRQNKRCSHVFLPADGEPYDINGKIFREPDGTTFTSSDSIVTVQFPYEPKTEYVAVDFQFDESV
jgi:hypothetical protein